MKHKKNKFNFVWSIRMLITTLCLSISFGFITQVAFSNLGIIYAILTIIFFIFVSTIFDMVGIASTSANIDYIKEMKMKKIEGSETALSICRNCEKVCSFCADVVGDICSTLCGAGGACIIINITKNFDNLRLITLVSVLTTAIIAGTTIFFKALMKEYAIKQSNKIIIKIGKIYERTLKKRKK